LALAIANAGAPAAAAGGGGSSAPVVGGSGGGAEPPPSTVTSLWRTQVRARPGGCCRRNHFGRRSRRPLTSRWSPRRWYRRRSLRRLALQPAADASMLGDAGWPYSTMQGAEACYTTMPTSEPPALHHRGREACYTTVAANVGRRQRVTPPRCRRTAARFSLKPYSVDAKLRSCGAAPPY